MSMVIDQINGKVPVQDPSRPVAQVSTSPDPGEELYHTVNRVARTRKEETVGRLLLCAVLPSVLNEGRWTMYHPYLAAQQACKVRQGLRLAEETQSLRVLMVKGLATKDRAFKPLIPMMRMPIGAERFYKRERGGPITLVMEMKPSGLLLAITSLSS